MDQLTAPPTDIRVAAEDALDRLGLTADDVADRMRALEIKGRRYDDNACPVSAYLGRLDGVVEVDVLETSAYVYRGGYADAIVVDLPEPVQVFVTYFDRGIYLDLVQVDTAAVAR